MNRKKEVREMFYKLMPLALMLIMTILVPIIVGVYVYRDASRRGMDATLWTLISVLAPMLVGFIVYMIIRCDYSNLTCPNCGNRLKNSWVVCPNCGASIKNTFE